MAQSGEVVRDVLDYLVTSLNPAVIDINKKPEVRKFYRIDSDGMVQKPLVHQVSEHLENEKKKRKSGKTRWMENPSDVNGKAIPCNQNQATPPVSQRLPRQINQEGRTSLDTIMEDEDEACNE